MLGVALLPGRNCLRHLRFGSSSEQVAGVGEQVAEDRKATFTSPMSALPKTPESTATIRFQDCDPFNHLNNGRYTDYFLNAREDHLLDEYGFDLYGIANTTGRTWVVSTSQIAYLRPAILMEKVVISSQLITYSPKHVEVEMQMWDKEKKVLKALCWMSFVHFDLRTNRSAEHIPEHMELFAQVCMPVEEKAFDLRVKGLRSKVV